MSDKEKTARAARGQDHQSAALGTGLIDVIMRGLEVAKRRVEGGDIAEPTDFCAFAYGERGNGFCLIAYWK